MGILVVNFGVFNTRQDNRPMVNHTKFVIEPLSLSIKTEKQT